MMRAMMEDLLSGWSVNDNKMSSFVAINNCAPLSNGMVFEAGEGVPQSSGNCRSGRKTRRYGWCPSLKPAAGGRDVGSAASFHNADAVLRRQGLDSQRLPLFSPYFSSTTRRSMGKSSNRLRYALAKDANPHRRGNNTLKPESCPSQAQPEASRQPASPRRLDGGTTKTLTTTFRPRKPTAPISRSTGSAFFECLASATFPRSGEHIRLPDVKCVKSVGDTAFSDTKRLEQEESSRDSSLQDSSQEEEEEEEEGEHANKAHDTAEGDAHTSVLEWDMICATETTLRKECFLLEKEFGRLRVQTEEATEAIEVLKTFQMEVQKKLQSLIRLRATVIREERKSRELQRNAKESVERMNHFLSNHPVAEVTADTAFQTACDGVGGVSSLAKLLDERSALRRERRILKEAICTANNAAAAAAMKSTTHNLTRCHPTGVLSSEKMRLYEESKMLKESIANMGVREQQFNERTKRSESRTAAIMERVDTLRLVARLQEQQWRQNKPCEPEHVRDHQMHEKNAGASEAVGSCFMTEVAA